VTPIDLSPFGVTACLLWIGYRLFVRGADRTFEQLGYPGLAVWYVAIFIGAAIGIIASGMYP
jgi:hypothetical protein